MEKTREILKKCFGYSDFRYGQEKLIDNIISGKHTLGIMPTGAGKSLCYQIPAIIFEGITIVISPLISLMKDQVDGLNEIGIPAGYINSSLSINEYNETMNNMMNQKYKIV